MARQRINMPSANNVVQTLLCDEYGNPLVILSATELVITLPNGDIQSFRSNQSLLLSCGTMWHPALWPKNPIGVCSVCRHPQYIFPFRERPSHGLVSLRKAMLCVSCGQLLCPRHRKAGSDRRWRCPSCHKKSAIRRLFSWIFFSSEEE